MRSRQSGARRVASVFAALAVPVFALVFALVFAMILAAVLWAPDAHARALAVLGVPMPAGSREAGGVVTSGRGFGQTVEFYKRFLKRAGVGHEAVPVYRYRGVDVARFLVRQGGTRWAAIHVYRHGGRTMIYVVPRDPLTAGSTQGKEASP
jgi:hypothetical protein